MKSRKKVAFVAGALVVLGAALAGWALLTLRSRTGPRDDLVGWYEYRYKSNDWLLPISKSDGIYYSACLGWEVALRESPEGLEFGDITIGFDEAANTHFIKIFDQQIHGVYGGRLPYNEKRPLTKVAKPSWFRGPEAQAPARRPRTNEDFFGWYKYVWQPRVRIEIRREGERCVCSGSYLDESGTWKPFEDPGAFQSSQELTPLPDALGFANTDRGGAPYMFYGARIIYNESLRRFELIASAEESPGVSSAPLIPVSHSSSSKEEAVTPFKSIGLPLTGH